MATYNESQFLFDSELSDSFGVQLASSIGSTTPSVGNESSFIVTTKSPFKETSDLHFIDYNEPLKFQIIVFNPDGKYIDAKQESQLNRWLCKNNRRWLQFVRENMDDVFYYCIIHNPQRIEAGRYQNCGILYDVECDGRCPWTGLNKKSYTCNTTLTFPMNLSFDYDQYILYPQLIITALSDTPVSITNNLTNDTVEFGYLFENEVVTLDCKSDKVSSSLNRVLIDTWNRNSLSLIEGCNQISLEGNFKIEFRYRKPVRIGG